MASFIKIVFNNYLEQMILQIWINVNLFCSGLYKQLSYDIDIEVTK